MTGSFSKPAPTRWFKAQGLPQLAQRALGGRPDKAQRAAGRPGGSIGLQAKERREAFSHTAYGEASNGVLDAAIHGSTCTGIGDHRVHRYALLDAAQAHRDLEARKTAGAIVLG